MGLWGAYLLLMLFHRRCKRFFEDERMEIGVIWCWRCGVLRRSASLALGFVEVIVIAIVRGR